jgi:uncharacterized membrane protein
MAATQLPRTEHRARSASGLILGVGLGGFADGIALHQIAQWHNMGSAKVPPVTMDAMRQNMLWDGLFHAAVWALTLAGVYLLLRDARRERPLPSMRAFTGQMLVGWGAFNVVDVLVFHFALGLHRLREGPDALLYDLGWLAMHYELDGQTYTVEYLEDPAVPSPSRYSERPYGRFGAFFIAELDEGQPLTMQYRLNVTRGAPPARQEIQQRYEAFLRELGR